MILPQIFCFFFVLFTAMEVKAVRLGGLQLHGAEDHGEAKEKLMKVLRFSNSELEVNEIFSYKTQCVAGTKHIVEYSATVGESGSVKWCETSWVSQLWRTRDPRYVETHCE